MESDPIEQTPVISYPPVEDSASTEEKMDKSSNSNTNQHEDSQYTVKIGESDSATYPDEVKLALSNKQEEGIDTKDNNHSPSISTDDCNQQQVPCQESTPAPPAVPSFDMPRDLPIAKDGLNTSPVHESRGPSDDSTNEPSVNEEKNNDQVEKPGAFMSDDDLEKPTEKSTTPLMEKKDSDGPSILNDDVSADKAVDKSTLVTPLEETVDIISGNIISPDSIEQSLPNSTVTKQTLQREVYDSGKEHPLEDTHDGPSDVSCLLKNVVLVQASPLEAVESEPEDVKPMVGESIDDIGRVEEWMENNAIEPNGLLVDDTDNDNTQHNDRMGRIEVREIEQIVPLEEPINDPNEMVAAATEGDSGHESPGANGKRQDAIHSERRLSASDNNGCASPETASAELIPDFDEVVESIGLTTDDEIELKRNSGAIIKQNVTESSESQSDTEEEEHTSWRYKNKRLRRSFPNQKKPTIRIVDVKRELLDVANHSSDDSMDPNTITPNKPDRSGSGSSSSGEVIPNDVFFGIQDRVYTVNTPPRHAKLKRDRTPSDDGRRKKRRNVKKVEDIACLKLPAYQQEQLQRMVLKKQASRDRFYDRSQDIPNDIYFENMTVPLHILHDTSSSSSSEESGTTYGGTTSRGASGRPVPCNRHASARSGRNDTENHSLQSMKSFLKIAGFRHLRYQKLWEGCHTSAERAEAILRFLQASGLQGEPTVAKCRELRKQIQLENEAKVLDVNAIISSSEGRITRQRTKMLSSAPAPTNTVCQPDEGEKVQAAQQNAAQQNASQTEEQSVPCPVQEQNAEAKESLERDDIILTSTG